MITNYENYEVAVINYPLMDPRIKPEDFVQYMQLDYTSNDSWEVPVYIHIPFCSSICKFCIYSRQMPDNEGFIVKEYVEALLEEIKMYGKTPYVQSAKIGSVFIGGGTPSCLSLKQIQELFKALRDYLPLGNSEITMECNIFSADEEKVHALSELGLTRLSTGIQTFNPKYRTMMDMQVTADKVYDWFKMARKYSFKDLSIDLLYGLPGQTCEEWLEDIRTGLSLPIDHFSIYKLIVFAYTKLYKELNNQEVPPLPDKEEIYRMYMEADKMLTSSGFCLQSSQEYCKEGRNAKFWDTTYDGYGDNLSLGAFSFGYLNGINYQNIVSPNEYISAVKSGRLPIKMLSSKVDQEKLMERTMLLSFRRSFVDKSIFRSQYGKEIDEVFGDILGELIEQDLVKDDGDTYRLTTLGGYYQGNVSARFMRSTFRNCTNFKKKMAIGMHIVPDVL